MGMRLMISIISFFVVCIFVCLSIASEFDPCGFCVCTVTVSRLGGGEM